MLTLPQQTAASRVLSVPSQRGAIDQEHGDRPATAHYPTLLVLKLSNAAELGEDAPGRPIYARLDPDGPDAGDGELAARIKVGAMPTRCLYAAETFAKRGAGFPPGSSRSGLMVRHEGLARERNQPVESGLIHGA